MISTGDLKKGLVIQIDGEIWQVLEYNHIKMGRGSAQVRIKLRNVRRGQTVTVHPFTLRFRTLPVRRMADRLDRAGFVIRAVLVAIVPWLRISARARGRLSCG